MRVRSSGKKTKRNVPGHLGRELPPLPRQLPKMPQRPIAPPQRIPPKGR
ncbi:hypothetical protein [Nonomuraea glycinis]|jgi:hypothetical protein|nr:hypothetical protein OHA68_18765 [Nonomuraea glycinis]